MLFPGLPLERDVRFNSCLMNSLQEIRKIRSLRLHAAQAYSRHIFEHEINVKVQKFTKKCMLNTSGCLVILISQ